MVQYKDFITEGLVVRIASVRDNIVFIGFPYLSSKGLGDTHRLESRFKDSLVCETAPLLEEAAEEIEQYLKGERRSFNLPIYLKGSDFQKKVWEAISSIPYGEERSYSEIAKEIGMPNGVRAVANAVGANPLSIVIPCHRVVGKNSPGGYAWGRPLKEYLQIIEKGST